MKPNGAMGTDLFCGSVQSPCRRRSCVLANIMHVLRAEPHSSPGIHHAVTTTSVSLPFFGQFLILFSLALQSRRWPPRARQAVFLWLRFLALDRDSTSSFICAYESSAVRISVENATMAFSNLPVGGALMHDSYPCSPVFSDTYHCTQ